jgi:hypothetical protein
MIDMIPVGQARNLLRGRLHRFGPASRITISSSGAHQPHEQACQESALDHRLRCQRALRAKLAAAAAKAVTFDQRAARVVEMKRAEFKSPKHAA